MMKRVISLLLVAVMVFGMTPVYTSANDAGESPAAIACNGEYVSAVTLPRGDAVQLQLKLGSGVGGTFQWQIHVSGDTWVNIQGAKGAELRVNYGMVANLLQGGAARIRCAVNNGSDVNYTNPVTVNVDFTEKTPVPQQTQQSAPQQQENPAVTAARAEVTAAETVAADAAKALAAAVTAVTEAEAALTAAEAAKTAADEEVKTAEAAKTTADAAVTEAYAALDQEKLAAARAAADAAAKAAAEASAAQKAYDDAVAAAAAAEKAIADTAAAAEKAKSDLTAAEEKAAAAKAELDAAAYTAYEAAVAAAAKAAAAEAEAAAAATAAAATAAEKEATAQAAAVAAADATADTQAADTAKAEAAAAEAKAASEAAAAKLTQAQADKTAAAKAAADAKDALNAEKLAAYEAAAKAAEAARKTAAEAQSASEKAPAAKTAADEAVTAAATKLEAAKTAAAVADKASINAFAALDQEKLTAARSAEGVVAVAAAKLAEAKAAAAAKAEAVTAAKAALDAANKAKTEAETADKDAKGVLEAVRKNLENAQSGRIMMFASRPKAAAAAEGENTQQYTVVFRYLKDGVEVSTAFGATLSPDIPISQTVPMPSVLGYEPVLADSSLPEGITAVRNDDGVLTALGLSFGPNATVINKNISIDINYRPALVEYRVEHYWQNPTDDEYSLEKEEVLKGYTDSVVGNVHMTDDPGVYHLDYEHEAIAADGSTVIKIYYDRNYYLINFDLGEGGYGVDPVYARYGAPIINQGEPSRPGYVFRRWMLLINDMEVMNPMPKTMPAENRTYRAMWDVDATAKVSIVFWGENADDTKYSYMKTTTVEIAPETVYTYSESDSRVCNKEEHDHNALNCPTDCGSEEHTHDSGCYELKCTLENHAHSEEQGCYGCNEETHEHSTACYQGVGNGVTNNTVGNDRPRNPSEGQVYRRWQGNQWRYYIYIKGSWYRYTGNTSSGNIAPLICGKTEQVHVHGATCITCTKPVHQHTDITGECYQFACTTPEHTHSESCKYVCGQPAHIHTNSCYISGAGMNSNLWTFERSDTVTVKADGSTVVNVYYKRTQKTLTFNYNYESSGWNSSYNSTETITAKWGQNIAAQYVAIAGNAGSTFWSAQYSGGTPYTNYFGVMPQTSATYYNRGVTGSNGTMYYYGENLDGEYVEMFSVGGVGGYSVTNEDRYEFEGFTYDHGTANQQSCTNAKFYYNRNSYNLVFNNGSENVRTESVKYEQPLASFADYEPDFPTDLYEPGSRYFDGWYLNPECSGEKVDLNTQKMPADNLILYAKWSLVTRTVTFYKTEDDMTAKDPIYDGPFTVLHGNRLNPTDIPTVPTRGSYKFEGWFYRNEKGEERAYNPELMPVNRDMEVYARWTSNTLVRYTIDYKVVQKDENGKPAKDTNGNWIFATEASGVIAPTVTGQAMAGTTKTFDAKLPTNATERTKVFPIVSSHTMTFDVEDLSKNQYTFPYWRAENVPYVVRHMIQKEDGTLILHSEDTVANNVYSVVTANYKQIAGYFPDAFQKTLILTVKEDGTPNTEANVITFIYTDKPIYVVRHYVEYTTSMGGKGWKVQHESIIDGTVGATYTAEPIPIPGYDFSLDYTKKWNQANKYPGEWSGLVPNDGSVDSILPVSVTVADSGAVSGTLGENGMYLNLYYTIGKYPAIAYYREEVTGEEVREPILAENQTYGTIYRNPLEIPGFTLTNSNAGVTVDIDKLDENGVPGKNKVTYWYTRDVGNLRIDKSVQAVNNGEPANTLAPDDTLFTFDIESISGAFPQSTEFTTFATELYSADGSLLKTGNVPVNVKKLTVQLKAGQYIIVKGLPTGQYTVKEQSILGYSSDAYAGVNMEVKKGETAQTSVENQYPIYTGDLNIQKVRSQRYSFDTLPADEEFTIKVSLTPDPAAMFVDRTFTVRVKDEKGEVQNGTGTNPGERITLTAAQYGTTATTWEAEYKVKGEWHIEFDDVPVGTYKAVETKHADYDIECEVFNFNNQVMTTYRSDNGAVMPQTQEIVADKRVSAKFTNYYTRHRGNLELHKTVVEEYENDIWDDSSFTFQITGTTTLADGDYLIRIANQNVSIKVENGAVKMDPVTMTIIDDDNSLTQTGEMVIYDLPVGQYTVTETTTGYTWKEDNFPYTTSVKTGSDENAEFKSGTTSEPVTIAGEETPQLVTFENIIPRTAGDLKISKEIVKYVPNATIDTEAEFTFQVQLTNNESLSGDYTVILNGEEDASVVKTASNGVLEIMLHHNEYAVIKNLPIGSYKIVEIAADGYDSSFQNVLQTQNTETTVEVKTNETTEVNCQNTYPIYNGHLIVSKTVVDTQQGLLARDRASADDVFTYKVVLSNVSNKVETFDKVQAVHTAANGTKTDKELNYNSTTGEIFFNLKAGESMDLDLPACDFTITETAVLLKGTDTAVVTDHYEVSHTASTGTQARDASGVTGSYSLASGGTVNVAYTNTWKRHLAELTLQKQGAAAIDENQSFIFDVECANSVYGESVKFTVVLSSANNYKEEFTNLPIGTYTVTERPSWSWRYEMATGTNNSVSEEVDGLDDLVTITNRRVDSKWLNGAAAKINRFDTRG